MRVQVPLEAWGIWAHTAAGTSLSPREVHGSVWLVVAVCMNGHVALVPWFLCLVPLVRFTASLHGTLVSSVSLPCGDLVHECHPLLTYFRVDGYVVIFALGQLWTMLPWILQGVKSRHRNQISLGNYTTSCESRLWGSRLWYVCHWYR